VLRIAVMNTKGGCGKTTVATNLASYCASQGYATTLQDYDRQASSTRWLKARNGKRAFIHGIAAFEQPRGGSTRAWQMQIPAGTRYVITDTPAGYSEFDIEDRVAEADVILIPVLPSSIDICSTADFIHDLQSICKARLLGKRLAIIANRTRVRTKAADKLEHFLHSVDYPVIARIRDTQHYVSAVEQGVGVHELLEYDAQKNTVTWRELLDWLDTTQETPEDLPKALLSNAGYTAAAIKNPA